jgi:hypothetical protein
VLPALELGGVGLHVRVEPARLGGAPSPQKRRLHERIER